MSTKINIANELSDYYQTQTTLEMDENVARLKSRLDVVRRHLKENPWPGGSKTQLLVIARGDSRWFALSGLIGIGSSDKNALQLNYSDVSREHCRLENSDDMWLLTDLDSTNGVYVNGNKISTSVLKDGDVIQLGNVMLIFIARTRE